MTPLELLPHRAPMMLLDAIVAHQPTGLVAEVTIGEDTLFLEADGVPSYVGLEYMAQACGAFAGAVGRAAGEPVKIGYLLGTRDYKASVAFFRRGERLTVTVTQLYSDDGMAAFDCRIDIAGHPVASARLAVYQPQENPIDV